MTLKSIYNVLYIIDIQNYIRINSHCGIGIVVSKKLRQVTYRYQIVEFHVFLLIVLFKSIVMANCLSKNEIDFHINSKGTRHVVKPVRMILSLAVTYHNSIINELNTN